MTIQKKCLTCFWKLQLHGHDSFKSVQYYHKMNSHNLIPNISLNFTYDLIQFSQIWMKSSFIFIGSCQFYRYNIFFMLSFGQKLSTLVLLQACWKVQNIGGGATQKRTYFGQFLSAFQTLFFLWKLLTGQIIWLFGGGGKLPPLVWLHTLVELSFAHSTG